MLGVVIGLLIGISLVWAQQKFGLVQFQEGGSYITDAYPVSLQLGDVLLVLVTVSTIGFFAAWYPVRVFVNRYFNERE